MSFDASHKPWLVVLVVLVLAVAGLHVHSPAPPSSRQGVALALAGTALAVLCGLLTVRKKLTRVRSLGRTRLVRTVFWEKGHIYLGVLGFACLQCHCGFRKGGPLTWMLLAVLWAIIISGLAGLLFRHLLVLGKSAREGKSALAASIIATGHQISLRLHVPLTVTLLTLAAIHAVMALFY